MNRLIIEFKEYKQEPAIYDFNPECSFYWKNVDNLHIDTINIFHPSPSASP